MKQTKRNRTAEADREGSSIIYQIFFSTKIKGFDFFGRAFEKLIRRVQILVAPLN